MRPDGVPRCGAFAWCFFTASFTFFHRLVRSVFTASVTFFTASSGLFSPPLSLFFTASFAGAFHRLSSPVLFTAFLRRCFSPPFFAKKPFLAARQPRRIRTSGGL